MGSKITSCLAAIISLILLTLGLTILILGVFLFTGDGIFSGRVSVQDIDYITILRLVDIEELLAKNQKYHVQVLNSNKNDIKKGMIQIESGCMVYDITKKEFLEALKEKKTPKFGITYDNQIKIAKEVGSNELVNICDFTKGYKILMAGYITAIVVCVLLQLVISGLTIGTICGCCARFNVPKIIVIMSFVTVLLSTFCVVLEIIKRKTFHSFMGLDENTYSKYNLPKKNINWTILLGSLTIITSNLSFLILMCFASSQRKREINNGNYKSSKYKSKNLPTKKSSSISTSKSGKIGTQSSSKSNIKSGKITTFSTQKSSTTPISAKGSQDDNNN
uniref:Col_cuticle_N domain-containing protein n=1 Tax=Parastrongyloides trichosuri TaxID=131310 RepID=A0A0N4ZVD4_PARTI